MSTAGFIPNGLAQSSPFDEFPSVDKPMVCTGSDPKLYTNRYFFKARRGHSDYLILHMCKLLNLYHRNVHADEEITVPNIIREIRQCPTGGPLEEFSLLGSGGEGFT